MKANSDRPATLRSDQQCFDRCSGYALQLHRRSYLRNDHEASTELSSERETACFVLLGRRFSAANLVSSTEGRPLAEVNGQEKVRFSAEV